MDGKGTFEALSADRRSLGAIVDTQNLLINVRSLPALSAALADNSLARSCAPSCVPHWWNKTFPAQPV